MQSGPRQAQTGILLDRRLPVVSAQVGPRDVMAPQLGLDVSEMRDPSRYVTRMARPDLYASERSVVGSVSADDTRAFRDAVDADARRFDGGGQRHAFGGTVAAPSGDSHLAIPATVSATRYADATLEALVPAVRHAQPRARDAEVREPSSRQYAYELTHGASERAGPSVAPEARVHRSTLLLPTTAGQTARRAATILATPTRVLAAPLAPPAARDDRAPVGTYAMPTEQRNRHGLTGFAEGRDERQLVQAPAPVGAAHSSRPVDWSLPQSSDRQGLSGGPVGSSLRALQRGAGSLGTRNAHDPTAMQGAVVGAQPTRRCIGARLDAHERGALERPGGWVPAEMTTTRAEADARREHDANALAPHLAPTLGAAHADARRSEFAYADRTASAHGPRRVEHAPAVPMHGSWCARPATLGVHDGARGAERAAAPDYDTRLRRAERDQRIGAFPGHALGTARPSVPYQE
jgi:hypothetical protein